MSDNIEQSLRICAEEHRQRSKRIPGWRNIGVAELMEESADRIEELEAEIVRLHNPHTGEECECDVCQRNGVKDDE